VYSWSVKYTLITGFIGFVIGFIAHRMPQYLNLIPDSVTAIAAITAAVAAWEGLNAWKKQLHGNKDHEIAWKYLEAVFKLRNAINKDVRNPFISIEEMSSASEEYYGKDRVQEILQKDPKAQTQAVYALRWREVQKARQNLSDVIVQAEIWFGEKVVGLENDLNGCIGELFVNIKNVVNPDYGRQHKIETVYFTPGLETDDKEGDYSFDKKLRLSIKKMEDFARLYLRHNNN
jgi:hypothetical protein